MGKWLQVKSAKAPDIIMWENLKISRAERAARILATSIFSLVLMGATFLLLLIAQYY